jgi:hypothetical protein
VQRPFFSAGGDLPLFSQPQPPPDPYRCHGCGTFLDDPGDRCPECCPDCPDYAGFPDCSACDKTQPRLGIGDTCSNCGAPTKHTYQGEPFCLTCYHLHVEKPRP